MQSLKKNPVAYVAYVVIIGILGFKDMSFAAPAVKNVQETRADVKANTESLEDLKKLIALTNQQVATLQATQVEDRKQHGSELKELKTRLESLKELMELMLKNQR